MHVNARTSFKMLHMQRCKVISTFKWGRILVPNGVVDENHQGPTENCDAPHLAELWLRCWRTPRLSISFCSASLWLSHLLSFDRVPCGAKTHLDASWGGPAGSRGFVLPSIWASRSSIGSGTWHWSAPWRGGRNHWPQSSGLCQEPECQLSSGESSLIWLQVSRVSLVWALIFPGRPSTFPLWLLCSQSCGGSSKDQQTFGTVEVDCDPPWIEQDQAWTVSSGRFGFGPEVWLQKACALVSKQCDQLVSFQSPKWRFRWQKLHRPDTGQIPQFQCSFPLRTAMLSAHDWFGSGRSLNLYDLYVDILHCTSVQVDMSDMFHWIRIFRTAFGHRSAVTEAESCNTLSIFSQRALVAKLAQRNWETNKTNETNETKLGRKNGETSRKSSLTWIWVYPSFWRWTHGIWMFLYVFPPFFQRASPTVTGHCRGVANDVRRSRRDTRGDLLENSQISYSYHISFLYHIIAMEPLL